MDTLSKVAVILASLFFIWMLVRYIRSNPESLSRASLSKSFYTMGLLGVGLIAFVTLIVMLLRR